MLAFLFSPAFLRRSQKFSWQAVLDSGKLIGGHADSLQRCERQAEKYGPLAYFVAGPAPMDWPKFKLPPFDWQQTIMVS